MSTQSNPSILSVVADWAVSLMEAIGPAGAGMAIALENIFPPIPSEVILPLAGLSVSQGSFTFIEALFWTTLGSVVGAFILYGLGVWLGVDRLRKIAHKLPLVKADDVDKTVAWFNKHGSWAVFFGRVLPIFRSLISIPAGVSRMPLWKFGLLTAAGSFMWNITLVGAGFYLGENWHVVERYANILQWVVIGAAIIAVGCFIIKRLKASKTNIELG